MHLQTIITLILTISSALVFALAPSNNHNQPSVTLNPNSPSTSTTINTQILRTNILRDQLNLVSRTLSSVTHPLHTQKATLLRSQIESLLDAPKLQPRKQTTVKPGREVEGIPEKIGNVGFDEVLKDLMDSYKKERGVLVGYMQEFMSGRFKNEKKAGEMVEKIEGALDLSVEGVKRKKLYGGDRVKKEL